MNKLFFCISLFCTLTANAQTYLISFACSGESATVGSVKVENLMSGASLMLNGGDILRLNIATGVNSIEDNNSSVIKIYPNPAADYAILEIYPPVAGDATITVSEMTGKPIARIQSYLEAYIQEFRLSGLSSGFYLVSVEGVSYRYSGKLLCTNKTEGIVRIEKISINQEVDDKTSKNESKGTQVAVDMSYSAGDRLKFTGISGIYSTVKADIPASDKTITFNFIACTDGDNNNYPVVVIGEQVWMAENLRTTTYNDAIPIPLITDKLAWSRLVTSGYCWFNNDGINFSSRGALYNWFAVQTGKICPTGWHVPSDGDLIFLSNGLGGDNLAGGKLRETGIVNWSSPNSGATNETGFTALSNGTRYSTGSFSSIGSSVYYWSSSPSSNTFPPFEPGGVPLAWYRALYSQGTDFYRSDTERVNGLSVRCLKNVTFP